MCTFVCPYVISYLYITEDFSRYVCSFSPVVFYRLTGLTDFGLRVVIILCIRSDTDYNFLADFFEQYLILVLIKYVHFFSVILGLSFVLTETSAISDTGSVLGCLLGALPIVVAAGAGVMLEGASALVACVPEGKGTINCL